MKKVIAALLLVIPVMALAGQDDLVCDYQGYASSPETFHNLAMEEKQTTFIVERDFVEVEGNRFDSVDPKAFDLKGLAITYLNKTDGSVLYLYVNLKGEKEVGISNVEVDSDNFFKDKKVFSKCRLVNNNRGETNGTSQSLSGVKAGTD